MLRARKNPLTPEQIQGLKGQRPAGPPPQPSTEPIRVQRRASNTGVIMVPGRKGADGRTHKHRTVTVLVSDTTLAIELDHEDTKVVRRTTTEPVRSIKGQRPRTATSVFLGSMSQIRWHRSVAHQLALGKVAHGKSGPVRFLCSVDCATGVRQLICDTRKARSAHAEGRAADR